MADRLSEFGIHSIEDYKNCDGQNPYIPAIPSVDEALLYDTLVEEARTQIISFKELGNGLVPQKTFPTKSNFDINRMRLDGIFKIHMVRFLDRREYRQPYFPEIGRNLRELGKLRPTEVDTWMSGIETIQTLGVIKRKPLSLDKLLVFFLDKDMENAEFRMGRISLGEWCHTRTITRAPGSGLIITNIFEGIKEVSVLELGR